MFRCFQIGFSLYERAWTMRGMENLLMDFIINPDFVHQLLDAICDYNLAQVTRLLNMILMLFTLEMTGGSRKVLSWDMIFGKNLLSSFETYVWSCACSRKICNDT